MGADLPFPKSLPDFQRLFPDDAACAKYLEAIRFRDGFVCPHCQHAAEPGRIASRPHVLRCKACRKETRLMAGTIMQDSHTPLSMLAWSRRDTGGWGLYTIALSTDEHTPILKASREKRILAAGRIPALVAQMRRVEAAQEIEARQARELLSDWLEHFDPASSVVPPPPPAPDSDHGVS